MRLHIGEKYLTRNGRLVMIQHRGETDLDQVGELYETYCVIRLDVNDVEYYFVNRNGRTWSDINEDDVVEAYKKPSFFKRIKI